MKKLVILAACLAVGTMAYGQGTFNMANKVTAAAIDAPVTDFAGVKLAGADFLAQLYAGTGGAFKPYGAPVPFRTGTAAGYFAGGTVTLADVAPGAKVDVQIRAWRAAAGANYEAAQAAAFVAGGNYGSSATIAGLGTGGVPDPATGIPSTPANLVGLAGFQFVPEPSTIALGLLGAAVLFLRRRK